MKRSQTSIIFTYDVTGSDDEMLMNIVVSTSMTVKFTDTTAYEHCLS